VAKINVLTDIQIFIKDFKAGRSSKLTFINGERLGPEGLKRKPYELKSDDIVVRLFVFYTLLTFHEHVRRSSCRR
jgi:hypothetical protein